MSKNKTVFYSGFLFIARGYNKFPPKQIKNSSSVLYLGEEGFGLGEKGFPII